MRRFSLLLLLIVVSFAGGQVHGEGQYQDIPRLPLCEDDPEVLVCEVVREWDVAAVQSRTESAWLDGDDLILVYRDAADLVLIAGDLGGVMRRLPDTEWWVLAVRIQGMHEGVISYTFLPVVGRSVERGAIRTEVWRGPDAPPIPPSVDELRGELQTHTIQNTASNFSRDVMVYVPPLTATRVVYMGDGPAVEIFAPFIEPLIMDGTLPSTMLVGVFPLLSPDPDTNLRAAEYLYGLDDSLFTAHERFFIEDVIPWAENTLNAPKDREQRAIFGFSDGAAFAVSMGLRHPELFRQVIEFSLWWTLEYGETLASPVRYYLLAGTLELHFYETTTAWAAILETEGGDYVFRERVAGHNFVLWREEFPMALFWAFATQ